MMNFNIDIDVNKVGKYTRIFAGLADNLSITRTQHENLATSYRAVGTHLENDPVFVSYHPVVSPQGSLRLGTIIQPINKDDDLDVDLVYRLKGKNPVWTQKSIKDLVGKRLREHGTYKDMLDEEGRRCWTLLYRQKSKDKSERYHMDILPCVANEQYDNIVREVLSRSYSLEDVDRIAIRITDKEKGDYATSTLIGNWLKSNPDGYAYWFASRCNTDKQRSIGTIMDAIMPIEKYTEQKSVLQKAVQILKRHRDVMFQKDCENKPISIIITTLAARAYTGKKNLAEALMEIVFGMENYIERDTNGHYVISNPVNDKENFADKWVEHPIRQINFFKWLSTIKRDFKSIVESSGVRLRENLGSAFGREMAEAVSDSIIADIKNGVSNGSLKVSSTGILGTIGSTVNATNTFHGNE